MSDVEKRPGPTLKEAFDLYLDSRDLADRTQRQYTGLVHVGLGDWLPLKVTDITKGMCVERHKQLSMRGKVSANCTMRLLKQILNFAAIAYEENEVPLILVNPVRRLSDARLWNKERPRFGRITTAQFPVWFNTILELKRTGEANETQADYLIFLVLTGLRRTEAACITWDTVNFTEATVTIPRTKNGDPHCLPLSDYLLDMLKRRHEEMLSQWVFPHRYGCGPLADTTDRF